jgi:hypothetical protein
MVMGLYVNNNNNKGKMKRREEKQTREKIGMKSLNFKSVIERKK